MSSDTPRNRRLPHTFRAFVGLLATVGVSAACNPTVVTPDEALHRALVAPSAYYLAVPLSGPRYRHANAFGKEPLPSGTRVRIVRIERGEIQALDQWVAPQVDQARLDRLKKRPYRVYFTADREPCLERVCEAHWLAEDDARFADRFLRVFVREDPLAGLDPEVVALVQAHRVASWFEPPLVELSLGAPNVVQDWLGNTEWVYEHRRCMGFYLVAEPRLALRYVEGRLEAYERMSSTAFYYPLEPVNPRNGLCRMRNWDLRGDVNGTAMSEPDPRARRGGGAFLAQ